VRIDVFSDVEEREEQLQDCQYFSEPVQILSAHDRVTQVQAFGVAGEGVIERHEIELVVEVQPVKSISLVAASLERRG